MAMVADYRTHQRLSHQSGRIAQHGGGRENFSCEGLCLHDRPVCRSHLRRRPSPSKMGLKLILSWECLPNKSENEQALTPVRLHNSLGATVVHPDLTPPQAFGIEFFGTFLLVLVIFAFSNENQTEAFAQAPLIIGLTVSAIVCSMVRWILFYSNSDHVQNALDVEPRRFFRCL